MNKKENHVYFFTEKKDLQNKLEKKIVYTQWIQAAGVFAEAVLLTKLYFLKDESEGEKKVLSGIWVQTIGQIIEAIGVTKEVSASNKFELIGSQKIAITGDALQR